MKSLSLSFTFKHTLFFIFLSLWTQNAAVSYDWKEANGGPVCEEQVHAHVNNEDPTTKVDLKDDLAFHSQYENNMRVSAVKCCRFESTGAVSGL